MTAGVPLERWEGLEADALAARWGVPAVRALETVGSTNDVARRLAAEGAECGTVVLAERQLAGRGRAGRGWSSPPGLGLWLSMVLRPRSGEEAAVLPLRVGGMVAVALDRFAAPRSVGVKWPNDLLIDGRKLGGVLCEAVWEGATLRSVIAGVGLNLLHQADDFPPELRDQATSVLRAGGRRPQRLEVATAVIVALAGLCRQPVALEGAALAELQARDVLRGQAVRVTDPATGALLVEGTALGIAPDGTLLVRSNAGAVRSVRSGTVRTSDGRHG